MSDTLASSAAGSTESASSSDQPTSSTSTSQSTPVDTASIAASVIQDMEDGDGDSGNEPVVREQKTQQDKQPAKADADPEDFDAVESERIDSLGRKRENAIPHSRVKAMIAKREAKAEQKVIAQIAKTLGITKAEAELKLDDVMGEVTTRQTKYSDYEQRVQLMDSLEQIAEQDDERYIRLLAQAHPQKYKRYVDFLDGKQGQSASGTAPVDGNDPMPEKDYPITDENGKVVGYTYSDEGLEKRLAWERRQGITEAEKKLGARLEPIEKERQDREKAQQRAAKAKEIAAEAEKAVTALLDRAQKWAGWKDHEATLLKAITENPNLDLRDAYIEQVLPKLSADRDAMRRELIEEQNRMPRNTSLGANATQPRSDKPKSTADIAREVMASLGT